MHSGYDRRCSTETNYLVLGPVGKQFRLLLLPLGDLRGIQAKIAQWEKKKSRQEVPAAATAQRKKPPLANGAPVVPVKK